MSWNKSYLLFTACVHCLSACTKYFPKVTICYVCLSLRMKQGKFQRNNFDKIRSLDLYQNVSTHSNFGQNGIEITGTLQEDIRILVISFHNSP
jgi:hypothetical protein